MNQRLVDDIARGLARAKSRRQLILSFVGGEIGRRGALIGDPQGSHVSSASAELTTNDIDYFALGDSIASGHGLQDDDGPDPPECCGNLPDICRSNHQCCRTCRRSARSYPFRVRQLIEESRSATNRYRISAFGHLACTGAAIAPPDVADQPPTRWLGNQTRAALSQLTSRPTLVSITIGANDFGWYDWVRTAIRFSVQSDEDFQQWAVDTTAQVVTELRAQIGRLLAFDNVAVVLTDQYNPFNRESWFFARDAITSAICAQQDCYRRASLAISILNEGFRRLTQELPTPERFAVAVINEGFRGHEAPRGVAIAGADAEAPTRELCCGTAEPDVAETWIQHRHDEQSNSMPCLGGEWRGDCFHPNARGAEFIALAVRDASLPLLAALVSADDREE